VTERTESHTRVFDDPPKSRCSRISHSPLMQRLKASGGNPWQIVVYGAARGQCRGVGQHGEDKLFDLRTGPFKGIGSLAKLANDLALRPA
jgi:hypothetical protein